MFLFSCRSERVMHGLRGDRVLMRVHNEEQDRWHGRPLYEAIVELLRKRGAHGVTALGRIVSRLGEWTSPGARTCSRRSVHSRMCRSTDVAPS